MVKNIAHHCLKPCFLKAVWVSSGHFTPQQLQKDVDVSDRATQCHPVSCYFYVELPSMVLVCCKPNERATMNICRTEKHKQFLCCLSDNTVA